METEVKSLQNTCRVKENEKWSIIMLEFQS